MGLPKVIYLARHGQTEWNRVNRYQGDPDLDEVGYLNRVSLWHLLKDRPIAAVYTSQLRRTQKTAELVVKQHDLTLEPRAALNEINSGVLEGICFSHMAPQLAAPSDHECEVPPRGSNPDATLKVVQAAFAQVAKDHSNGHFPLAESYGDVAKRTAPFVEELRRGFREREVLVVGHGVVNEILLHHLMGWPLDAVIRLRQENDQVFALTVPEKGPPRLSLYTPGHGWRMCRSAPRSGDKHLDCHPTAPSTERAPLEGKTGPSSAPSQ